MNQITKIETAKNTADSRYALWKMLNEMDDRRERAEKFQEQFNRSEQVSGFYPGYSAEELDDGRLDAPNKTGFVPVDEIRNHYRKESWTELPVEAASQEEPKPAVEVAVTTRSSGPASNRNYRKEFRSKLPRLENVFVLERGKGLVAYKPLPYRPSMRPF